MILEAAKSNIKSQRFGAEGRQFGGVWPPDRGDAGVVSFKARSPGFLIYGDLYICIYIYIYT